MFFLTENYCPDPKGADSPLRRPATEDSGGLSTSRDNGQRHQPELFSPPDPALWTAARSCASMVDRQALLDHLGSEIRWQSSQLHKLRRSARGRILDCCDYFDGRKFSLQELKRRYTELGGLLDRSAEFEFSLNKPTRRETRRRKSAPFHLRLAAYLDPIGRAGEGAWKPCPSYEALAKALDVSQDTISQAFRRLEEDPKCPLAFVCAYSGASRCRQKHVALKSWLKFDKLPLHFEEKGRHRKLRPTFRKGVERIEPDALIAERHGKSAEVPASSHSTAGNSEKCLSHSIRLSPAVLDNPQPTPAKSISRPLTPNPRRAAMSRNLEKAAWRAAREAKSDGELFWDNSKVKIPLPTLKTLIMEAFQQGFEWKKHVRPALVFGIKEAHAAACLGSVRNPGAFAAAIYRQKLASTRPDLDHLAQVIEKRRSTTSVRQSALSEAPCQPQSEELSATPLPRKPNLEMDAGAKAMDRLAAYIEQNHETIALLSPEASEAFLFGKYEEFNEEEKQ